VLRRTDAKPAKGHCLRTHQRDPWHVSDPVESGERKKKDNIIENILVNLNVKKLTLKIKKYARHIYYH